MAKIREINYTHKATGAFGRTKVHYLATRSEFAVDVPSAYQRDGESRVYGGTEREAISAFHEHMNSTFRLADHLEKVIQYRIDVSCGPLNPEAKEYSDRWGVLTECVERAYHTNGPGHKGVRVRPSDGSGLSIKFRVTWRDTRPDTNPYNRYFAPNDSSADGYSRDNHTLSACEELPFSEEAIDFLNKASEGIDALAKRVALWFVGDGAKATMASGVGCLKLEGATNV